MVSRDSGLVSIPERVFPNFINMKKTSQIQIPKTILSNTHSLCLILCFAHCSCWFSLEIRRVSQWVSVHSLFPSVQGRTGCQSHPGASSWRQECCCHLLEPGIRDEPSVGGIAMVHWRRPACGKHGGWYFARLFPVLWWKPKTGNRWELFGLIQTLS